MSIVEETLRSQRESWREIYERVSQISSRELPSEQPKRLILFGIGSSFYAAKLAAYALIRDKSRLRLPIICVQSTAIGTEVHPTKGDWVFAFSHRATGAVTLQALEFADRGGAFTVLVCGKQVQQPETARFMLPTTEMERCEPHTASVTGAICAVTSLLLGGKAVEEWDALRSIGDPDLDLMRRRAGEGPTILLGEWEGEWLAREGALKFMEMARVPVRPYASEEFFHGPRFAATQEDRIWHISMPKDPRNAEITALKPGHTIGVFGATPLAFLPALVELQWLGLAVALNRGVDPDSPQLT